VAAWVLQSAKERPTRWVKGADPAVAEVAGQQVIAEPAEPAESQGPAAAGTKPVVGLLTAGHLLGRAAHARCWLVAVRAPRSGQQRHSSASGTDQAATRFSSRRAFPEAATDWAKRALPAKYASPGDQMYLPGCRP